MVAMLGKTWELYREHLIGGVACCRLLNQPTMGESLGFSLMITFDWHNLDHNLCGEIGTTCNSSAWVLNLLTMGERNGQNWVRVRTLTSHGSKARRQVDTLGITPLGRRTVILQYFYFLLLIYNELYFWRTFCNPQVLGNAPVPKTVLICASMSWFQIPPVLSEKAVKVGGRINLPAGNPNFTDKRLA